MKNPYLKMYIAVLDEVMDGMVPTLVAHTTLGVHLKHYTNSLYDQWLSDSFRKVVVKVDRDQFERIRSLETCDKFVYEGSENKTLNGLTSCLITVEWSDKTPDVLRKSSLWEPSKVSTLNIDKAADLIITDMAELVDYFKVIPKDQLKDLHHTIGVKIRDRLNLWLYDWIPVIGSDGADHSPNHPDNISMVIMDRMHDKLNYL